MQLVIRLYCEYKAGYMSLIIALPIFVLRENKARLTKAATNLLFLKSRVNVCRVPAQGDK